MDLYDDLITDPTGNSIYSPASMGAIWHNFFGTEKTETERNQDSLQRNKKIENMMTQEHKIAQAIVSYLHHDSYHHEATRLKGKFKSEIRNYVVGNDLDGNKLVQAIKNNYPTSIFGNYDHLHVEDWRFGKKIDTIMEDTKVDSSYSQDENFYAARYGNAYWGRSTERSYYDRWSRDYLYGEWKYKSLPSDFFIAGFISAVDDDISKYKKNKKNDDTKGGGIDNRHRIIQYDEMKNEYENKKLFAILNRRNILESLEKIEIDEMEDYDIFIHRLASTINNNKYSDDYLTPEIKNRAVIQNVIREDTKLILSIF